MLFFDEFQAIRELHPQLARRLKALADEYGNVSLVLAGSKAHLMESLVLSKGAPLYKMLERLALGPIPVEDWVPFLLRQALSAGKPFAEQDVALEMWNRAQPVPFDIQQLAYESFNQATDTITPAALAQGIDGLIRHEAADYAKTFEKLSAGQRRVLKALASGPPASVGSAEFATAVELADSTSVRKALKALGELELVVRRADTFAVDDPFFAAWLRGGDF